MKLREPGAQPKRTALAWTRTTTALIIAGLLCVRAAPSGTGAAAAAAVVCGGAALLLRISGVGLRVRHRRVSSGGGVADPVSALAVTGLTILLAVVAFLITF